MNREGDIRQKAFRILSSLLVTCLFITFGLWVSGTINPSDLLDSSYWLRTENSLNNYFSNSKVSLAYNENIDRFKQNFFRGPPTEAYEHFLKLEGNEHLKVLNQKKYKNWVSSRLKDKDQREFLFFAIELGEGSMVIQEEITDGMNAIVSDNVPLDVSDPPASDLIFNLKKPGRAPYHLLLYECDLDLDSVVEYYQKDMQKKGWSLNEKWSKAMYQNGGFPFLKFDKQSRECLISLTDTDYELKITMMVREDR